MSKEHNVLWEYKSYVIMIVACVVLLFIKQHVVNFLDKCTEWIHSCSVLWFAVLITGSSLVLSVCMVAKIIKKKQAVAHSTMAIAMFAVLFYTYFRFIDNTYNFWGLGWYKWCDIVYLPFILLTIQKIICYKKQKDSLTSGFYIIDRPIEGPSEDRFGYDWMSQSMMNELLDVDVSNKSYSVGIIGIWGQGKSSFLNLFKLHAEKESIVVEFYPRASKSIKNIQEDFFNALKSKLKHYHTGINRYISNYAREVAEVDESWLGKVALAFNNITIENERNRINAVIKSIGRRIFVIIEDLDRLTGEEILEVLKLLERNGDFCNTVFITAYDKKYVNDVIGKYLKHSIKEDYTDKYFDFEYSLPKNNDDVLLSFAGKYLTDKIRLEKEDGIRLEQVNESWYYNGSFIVSRLGTMRHIKRYLNIFLSRYPKVKNDVDISDFMVLTLLRYLDLEAYNAVFEYKFLKRGSLVTNKLIFLQKDYEEKMKELGIKDSSKQIIEKLFKVEDNFANESIQRVYGKLRWVESFKCYFFDYRIGKYHYEDFQRLFTVDEEAAISSVEEMQKAGISTQLTDFLKSRNVSWFVDENGISRYIKIVTCLNSLKRSHDLDYILDDMLDIATMDDYVRSGVVKDEKTYKDIVRKTIEEIVNKYSMEVSFSCQRILSRLYERNTTDDGFVFTSDELIDFAIMGQRSYYKKYATKNYLIDAILNLAKVEVRINGTIEVAETAKRELITLMDLYPEQFATDIIVSSIYDSTDKNKKLLRLRFIDSFEYDRLLTLDDFSFAKWVDNLSDMKIKYVLNRILKKGKNDALQVYSLRNKYEKGDFDGYYEAVKAFDDQADEDQVLDVINNHISIDYSVICTFSGLDIVRAKNAIARLVSRGLIDKRFNMLKEKMDSFEIGDFVKLNNEVYDMYTKDLYYSDNIFKITEIKDGGSYRLANIAIDVPQKDIEAIPIDGKNDRNIYYDPIIAAPFITAGNPVPSYSQDPTEYYMDGLKKTIYENKSLRAMIEKNNCQFVHEVQHFLRNKGGDYLKLNESIKSN